MFRTLFVGALLIATTATASAQNVPTYAQSDPAIVAAIQSLGSKLDVLAMLQQQQANPATRPALGTGTDPQILQLLIQLATDRRAATNEPREPGEMLALLHALQTLGTKIDSLADHSMHRFGIDSSSREHDHLRQELGTSVLQRHHPAFTLPMMMPQMQMAPAMPHPMMMVPQQQQAPCITCGDGVSGGSASFESHPFSSHTRQIGPYTIRSRQGLFKTHVSIE